MGEMWGRWGESSLGEHKYETELRRTTITITSSSRSRGSFKSCQVHTNYSLALELVCVSREEKLSLAAHSAAWGDRNVSISGTGGVIIHERVSM